MVSEDHYISRASDSIYHANRKPDLYEMFSGRWIFVDNISGYMSINNQLDINNTETFKDKCTFHREDQSKGDIIKGCYTDNGVFN